MSTGDPNALGKLRVRPLAAPVRALHGSIEVGLQPVGGVDGELFEGLAQARDREPQLVERRGEVVEDLLPGLRPGDRHGPRLFA